MPINKNHLAPPTFDASRGDRGRVTVDGLRRALVVRGCVGVNGWAEQLMTTPDGRPIVDKSGKGLAKRILRGVVHFEPLRQWRKSR